MALARRSNSTQVTVRSPWIWHGASGTLLATVSKTSAKFQLPIGSPCLVAVRVGCFGEPIRGGYRGPMPKPDVTIPAEQPPADLVTEDLTVGDGAEAGAGQEVEVHYVGVSWS